MPRRFCQRFLCLLMLFCASGVSAAVLVKERMWPGNSQLNVVFIDGDSWQKALVKKYAPLWLAGSSLSMRFFDGFTKSPKETHIRVGFSSHTGSRLGDHGDYQSKEATLLLHQLSRDVLLEKHSRRIILHEFGHALGFEHEYRNPKWPYGDQALKQHVASCLPRMRAIGEKPARAKQRCLEINSPLSTAEVKATVYDELSIMNYAQELVLDKGQVKQIRAKNSLSALDKLAMENWYGKSDSDELDD